MSIIKPFEVKFIDPDTMAIVDLNRYTVHVNTDKKGNLFAWVMDIEYPQEIKQLLIKNSNSSDKDF